MQNEPITSLGVHSWLADQQLVYASWPTHGVRLRLIYWPRSKTWEVTLGVAGVLCTTEDINKAVDVFNSAAGVSVPAN